VKAERCPGRRELTDVGVLLFGLTLAIKVEDPAM
jgi:hypothetical protein